MGRHDGRGGGVGVQLAALTGACPRTRTLNLGDLRVAKVHDLVEQLVDQNEVVANALFLKLAKILAHNLDQALQKDEYGGHVRVTLGQRDDIDIRVLHSVFWRA